MILGSCINDDGDRVSVELCDRDWHQISTLDSPSYVGWSRDNGLWCDFGFFKKGD